MTDKPDETAGTPPADDGDAAEDSQTTGTPPGDDRDASQGEPDYKALHLANKQTIEALTAKVTELAQQIGSQPATESAGERGNQEKVGKLLADAERLASVDPVAALVLQERAERLQDRQDYADAMVLNRLPAEKQKPTLDFYLKNKHRFGDLAAASEALNGRESQTRLAQVEKELAEAKKQLANGGEPGKDRDDVVRTHGRDVSTPTHKARTYTEQQFDTEKERIARDQGPAAAREFEMKLRRGEILLKG